MDLTPIESFLLCFERKASKHIYLLMSFLSLIYFLKDILNRYRANLARLYTKVCGGWCPVLSSDWDQEPAPDILNPHCPQCSAGV